MRKEQRGPARSPATTATTPARIVAAAPEGIPLELRERDQWVVWKRDERDGKTTKVPYRADGAGRASATDPSTWATFPEAVAAADELAADGIGYVFSADDPYVGVDLDAAMPEIDKGAIMAALDSYSEHSVSGKGYHVIVKATLNGHPRNRKGPLEVYESGRFFVMTGQHVVGTPTSIEERQEKLEEVLEHFLPAPPPAAHTARPSVLIGLDDQELLSKAMSARNGGNLSDLYEGRWENQYPSRSEADLALCSKLAFWTAGDGERIDRLFRSSGLMRPKWDRDDYRKATIETAISGSAEAYSPSSRPTRDAVGTQRTQGSNTDVHEAEKTGFQGENAFRGLRDTASRKESSLPSTVLSFERLSVALENVSEVPDWVWEGYVARGATSLFAGRPKVGKSTLLFGLLAALRHGEPFLSCPTHPVGVLLLSEEPVGALRQKASRFGLDLSFRESQSLRPRKEKDVHLLRRTQALATSWPEVVEQAVVYAQEQELGLLVVDTFDKWTGLRGDDENKTGAILGAFEPLLAAVAAGLAVLIVTHHRKSGGKFGEGVRGANALVGSVDIVLEVDRLPVGMDPSQRGRLLSSIGRFEEVPDRVLELDAAGGGYRELGDVETVRLDRESGALLAALQVVPRPAAIGDVATQLDVAEATARGRLQAAYRRGEVTRAGSGRKGDPFIWGLPGDAAADEAGDEDELEQDELEQLQAITDDTDAS